MKQNVIVGNVLSAIENNETIKNLKTTVEEQSKKIVEQLIIQNTVEPELHDNCWLYDGAMNIHDGYRCYVIPIESNKKYKITRNTSGAIHIGYNKSGWHNNYLTMDYSTYYGDSREFIAPDDYKYVIVFIGKNEDNPTIEVTVYENVISKINDSFDDVNDNFNTFEQLIGVEYGNIDVSTGDELNAVNRVRTDYIRVNKGDTIKTYYESNIIFFNLDKKALNKQSYTEYNWWTTKYTFNNDYYIRCVFRKDSNNSDFNEKELSNVSKGISLTRHTKQNTINTLHEYMRIRAEDSWDKQEQYIIDNNIDVYKDTYTQRGKIIKNGKKIIDKNGNELVLTGIGTNWLNVYQDLYTSEVFKTLIYNGINCIRLSVYVSDKNPIANDFANGHGYKNHSDEIKEIIDKIIPLATTEGLYILLDWHSYHTYDGGDVTKDIEYQKEFFTYFSNKYCEYDNILYELHNEPYQNTSSELLPSVQACCNIIRSNTPDAIIICGHGSDNARNMNKLFNEDNDLDVFISVHIYTGDQDVTTISKYSDIPLFMTEWGNSALSGDTNLRDDRAIEVFNYCHENNISYCLWKLTYQNMSTSVLEFDRTKIEYLYPLGGWKHSDLSHNGKLYFDTIKKYRFSIP